MIPRLLHSPNMNIANNLRHISKRKRTPKKISTLARCHKYLEENDLIYNYSPVKTSSYPSWCLSYSSFILDLMACNKSNTPIIIFQKMFAEVKSLYEKLSWQFIFTDGSKSENNTSYAVVRENGVIINIGTLQSFCSVFLAEATAILKAIEFIECERGKFVICTDSQSVLNATLNISNHSKIITEIRDKMIRYKNKIKIMWIPGHSGIRGNENADLMANQAALMPTYIIPRAEKSDWLNFIKQSIRAKELSEWSTYTHRYTTINTNKVKTHFPSQSKAIEIKIFTRLRLGHSKLTHQHLLCGKIAPSCVFCDNAQLSIGHILDECSAFQRNRTTIFGNNKPSDFLKEPLNSNIEYIFKFIFKCNLINQI